MTEIKVGQIWRRKADLSVVVVVSAAHIPAVGWSIARWKRIDTGRTGDLDFGSFLHRYEFIREGES